MRKPTRKQIQAKIVRLLAKGHTVRSACAIVGISRQTFYRWQQSSTSFAEAVERALDEATARMEEVIIEQATKKRDPRYAIWWLERRAAEYRPNRVQPLAEDYELHLEVVKTPETKPTE
jgi:transposase